VKNADWPPNGPNSRCANAIVELLDRVAKDVRSNMDVLLRRLERLVSGGELNRNWSRAQTPWASDIVEILGDEQAVPNWQDPVGVANS